MEDDREPVLLMWLCPSRAETEREREEEEEEVALVAVTESVAVAALEWVEQEEGLTVASKRPARLSFWSQSVIAADRLEN
jgi:hypothetical protein